MSEPVDPARGNEEPAADSANRMIAPRATHDPIVIVGLITVVGAILRFYHLGFKSLWFDEAVMFWVSEGSLETVLANNAALNSAPPLFAVLLQGVIGISSSEAALRAIACVAGVLAIPAIYLLARQFASSWAVYVAPALVAAAPQQIRYAQQVREYSLTVLLATLLLLAFVVYLRRPTWRAALILGVLYAVSLFTQYGLGLVIGSISVIWIAYLARTRDRRKAAAQWVVVNGVGLVAVAAVYLLALRYQFTPGGRAASYLAGGYGDGTLGSLLRLGLGNTLEIVQFTFPGALFLFVLLLGMAAAVRARTWLPLLLLTVPMTLTLAAAIPRLYPYIADRHTMYLAPMLYVFAALGVQHLASVSPSRLAPSLLLLLLFSVGFKETASYLRSRAPENLRPIAATVRSVAAAAEPVYVSYGARPAFSYYMRGAPGRWIGRRWGITAPDREALELESLAFALRGSEPVWLVVSRASAQEEREILALAADRRRVRMVQAEEDVTLYLAE